MKQIHQYALMAWMCYIQLSAAF